MTLEVILWIFAFAVSLAVLIKASDYFTDAAENLGLLLGLPAFIVGVTIVSIGTSLPELTSSIVSVIRGSSEIVVANVIGSNISNIFLVLGTAAILSKTLRIRFNLLKVDLPLFVASAFFLALTVRDGEFSLGEAILCLASFCVYLLYAVSRMESDGAIEDSASPKKRDVNAILRQTGILLLSSVFIFIGANYTIESIENISTLLNVGQEVISISVLALGTSLPELIVTISFSRKGNPEIAIGNVLGSNIFNSTVVTGVSRLFGPLVLSDVILDKSLAVMLIGTLLFFFATQDRQVTRWEGMTFLILYGWFLGATFDLL
ncbi:MAG: calcium/sodium antiporter [Cyanobacteriota bacterium]|nr:calcium/sodium antiporter [Cyanobacteriota bacterium]